MSRFAEASAVHSAIHALRLRSQVLQPGLTEDQQAQRLRLIETMCRLLAKHRDEMIDLGIVEWSRRDT